MHYLFMLVFLIGNLFQIQTNAMDWVQISDDQKSFVLKASGNKFSPWGVNYDHDVSGRLLDEYWITQWESVVEDFNEIKSLGANCVRIHLQLGKFMDTPDKPNAAALAQLAKLTKLAETTGLYLDITGLACYHKENIPPWYDALEEQDRWDVQARFWKTIAKTCNNSPAIFCYDLMNEPVIGGAKSDDQWLAGEPLGEMYFVQRIVLKTGERKREDIAHAWVQKLTKAIRQEDPRHLITLGVIPWANVWPNAKPIFYSEAVAKHLDFVSVHFYPKSGELEKSLSALRVYDIGKPIVVEETFPLKCSTDELLQFVHSSNEVADGWISFYWGKPASEYDQTTIAEAITVQWLEAFRQEAETQKR